MATLFIADAIITSLRAGNRPADTEADELDRLPLIDELRRRVTAADVPWLLTVVEAETGAVAALFLSLLRHFASQEEIHQRLRARWETADPFLRAHLLWRLLDNPSLPAEWHQRLFDFVLHEWATFNAVSTPFFGTSHEVLPRVLQRLADPSFPSSKKWAYLCRLPEAADDQAAARALVRLGLLFPDPFTRKVAGKLLAHFWCEKGSRPE